MVEKQNPTSHVSPSVRGRKPNNQKYEDDHTTRTKLRISPLELHYPKLDSV